MQILGDAAVNKYTKLQLSCDSPDGGSGGAHLRADGGVHGMQSWMHVYSLIASSVRPCLQLSQLTLQRCALSTQAWEGLHHVLRGVRLVQLDSCRLRPESVVYLQTELAPHSACVTVHDCEYRPW